MKMATLFKKTLLGQIILFGVVAITTSAVSAWNIERHLKEEFRSKGTAIARSLANSSENLISASPAETTQAAIDQLLEIRGISYVFVIDANQEIIAHTFVPNIPSQLLNLKPDTESTGNIVVQQFQIQGIGNVIDISAPILAGAGGYVHVGMNQDFILAEIRASVLHQLSLMVLLFFLSAIATYILVKKVSQPLSQLSAYAAKLASQDFDATIEIQSQDEVGLLATTMQSMAKEIRGFVGRLEQGIHEATRELQEALLTTQQAEEKYRQIFENATDGIFQTTPDGHYISANPTLARIYGYSSPEELMTQIQNVGQQLYVNSTRRAEFLAALKSHDFVSQFESQIYRRDGSVIWISENARAVKDANGVLLYYEGTVEDITQRKYAEVQLQENETRLQMQQIALMELAKCQPLYTGNLNAALQEITETGASTLWVDRVSVWFYNEDRSKLHCADLYTLMENQHSEGLELSACDYPRYFQALEADETIAAEDAHTDARTQEFSEPYLKLLGISSMLDIPIRLDGRTIGVLCHEQMGSPRKWRLEEQNFASYLAYMVCLAIEARDRKQAQEELRLEREKAEQLLLNILPEAIADRLKQEHGSIADNFEEVSVLFADIVGFTQLASHIPPRELVGLLNQIFSAFDQLAEQHGLEKIKTIGDAYMVVAGLPKPRTDHADAIAQMALDMQQEIAKFSIVTGETLSIRIGINSGPVVAGVIGIKKFIYDLWGDTVNIASRMESQGVAGCIQVTEVTYELLKDKYLFQDRGTIKVKGKGEMKTYLLTGRKTSQS